jgi:hypothetical protein
MSIIVNSRCSERIQLNHVALLNDSDAHRRIDGGTDKPASEFGYHLLYNLSPGQFGYGDDDRTPAEAQSLLGSAAKATPVGGGVGIIKVVARALMPAREPAQRGA